MERFTARWQTSEQNVRGRATYAPVLDLQLRLKVIQMRGVTPKVRIVSKGLLHWYYGSFYITIVLMQAEWYQLDIAARLCIAEPH